MKERLARALLIGMAIVAVATVLWGIWMAYNVTPTIRHAECPPGYDFVPKHAFTSRSWCVNGELAVEPTWTNVQVTP